MCRNKSLAAVSLGIPLLGVHLRLIGLLCSGRSLLHCTPSAPPSPSTSVPLCSTILFSAPFLFSLHWFVRCAFISLLFPVSLSPCASVWLLKPTMPQLWGWPRTRARSAVSAPRPAPRADLLTQRFCAAIWDKVQQNVLIFFDILHLTFCYKVSRKSGCLPLFSLHRDFPENDNQKNLAKYA